MADRKLSASTAITGANVDQTNDQMMVLDVSDITDAATGTNKKIIPSEVPAAIGVPTTDLNILAYQALGSPIKIQTVDCPFMQLSTSSAMTNQQLRLIALEYLHAPKTFTGFKIWQVIVGNYTANNENRVGLYSYSGGTCTLVASSTNDGTLWQTAGASSVLAVPFSSTYAAPAGQYFAGLLYSRSAETTAPTIGQGATILNAAASSLDFTNSAKIYGIIAAQTTLPSSFLMSSVTANNQRTCVGAY